MNEPRRMCATPLQVLMNPALGRQAPAEVPNRCLSGAALRNRTTTDGAGRSITAMTGLLRGSTGSCQRRNTAAVMPRAHAAPRPAIAGPERSDRFPSPAFQ